MAYQIRHKETGKILRLRSGKSVWAQIGHAKAAYRTSGLSSYGHGEFSYKYWGAEGPSKFDDQDVFEIVEVKDATHAVDLLQKVLAFVDKSDPLHQEIQEFLKEVK